MLTGTQILIVGGDNRQLEVIKKLSDLNATVKIIGFENMNESFPGVEKVKMSTEWFKQSRIVILPASGTDVNGGIASTFSTDELKLTADVFESIPNDGMIISGAANAYLKNSCEMYKIKLVELFARDDVAIFNSIPTAEGAIMMAIQNTDFTIHGSINVVLGLGRVGLTLARTLKGLGAKVKVGVREPDLFARAWEMGLTPFYIEELHNHVQDADILFNTIPALVVTKNIISNIERSTLIIDLASKPGGTDFLFAEKYGIKAILAPGLPGIVAPRTAGCIMADAISQLLISDYS
ncbi:dipicolinate synthase subunit DpsA [Paenibacillus durus]|uniref:Dipicolinate synthase subunit A n=1 Tax=Paenibacillus durus TaxID=44251 RepID=A0A089HVK5_PAEDU|nr:dipicolinate synthase subunit DpsA [Paenibacillus durus]AIQ15127.1 dipicolinate synthase subunit A [Paenibacillus durus]